MEVPKGHPEGEMAGGDAKCGEPLPSPALSMTEIDPNGNELFRTSLMILSTENNDDFYRICGSRGHTSPNPL